MNILMFPIDKVTKFESNSQLLFLSIGYDLRCFYGTITKLRKP